MVIRILLTAWAVFFMSLPGQGIADEGAVAFLAEWSVPVPQPDGIIVCHGYGCQVRTEVGLSNADQTHLASLMARGRTSAAAERRAIAAAVAWFDRRVGPEAGTTGRIARAGIATASDPRQMDCIDLSLNNTGLFLILEELHLLHHHLVARPVGRGALIDGRLPHATAVLRDSHDGREWAFDSWTHRFGEQPDVKPLAAWLADPDLSL